VVGGQASVDGGGDVDFDEGFLEGEGSYADESTRGPRAVAVELVHPRTHHVATLLVQIHDEDPLPHHIRRPGAARFGDFLHIAEDAFDVFKEGAIRAQLPRQVNQLPA